MSNVHNQNRQAIVYSVTGVLLAKASLAVGMRLYARKISSARFLWDDLTIVIALVRGNRFKI